MDYTLSMDEAARFLKVTRSTLYKWLSAGKIPAKKLGGQWRFSEEELRTVRDGGNEKQQLARELAELAAFFQSRVPRAKGKTVRNEEKAVDASVEGVADAIVWDAVDREASDIHLQPRGDGVHLSFRIKGKLEPVRTLSADAAKSCEQSWVSRGVLSNRTGQQQVYLGRKTEDGESQVQLFVQGIDTLQGRCVTLRVTEAGLALPLSRLGYKKADLERMERWLAAPYGLILLAGRSGSGKTKTLFSCLRHLVQSHKGAAIFSIEDPVTFRLEGVDQIEVDGKDPNACRDAFDQVMRSAPDIVATTLDNDMAARWALDAAKTGHLVLMQIQAPSAQEAIKRFEALAGEPLEKTPVLVAYQELVGDEAGQPKAIYTFLE